jgi:hypothetical protein
LHHDQEIFTSHGHAILCQSDPLSIQVPSNMPSCGFGPWQG